MPDSSEYRFADFVVSRRRRQVFRSESSLPLIPRYFDLLVLLIERRGSVVTRREIFDAVWGDVFVSDGALTQAIRTIRRTLGDDSRDPLFIRTASRHGYSFVFTEVVETDDDLSAAVAVQDDRVSDHRGVRDVAGATRGVEPATEAQWPHLIDRICGVGADDGALDERREAAQQLHLLGTARALAAIRSRPRPAAALALMRDTRWDVPGAGAVPLGGDATGLAAALLLVRWRTRDALRIASRRWVQAAGGAALAGAGAGLAGGLLLVSAPASSTPVSAVVVLAILGALAGFAGAAGVAAGMAAAEAVARSRRSLAIVLGGAAGGLVIGGVLRLVVSATLEGLFGLRIELGGPFEGLCLGAAVAAGYAGTTTLREGGMAAPTGAARWRTAGSCGVAGGITAVLLSLTGHPLVGGTINAVAQASSGSQVALAPLGAWLGEPAFGPVTQSLVALAEGALFGSGLAWGLTRRPGRP